MLNLQTFAPDEVIYVNTKQVEFILDCKGSLLLIPVLGACVMQ